MTKDEIKDMGYEYDILRRSHFLKGDTERKFAIPPFGFTDLMLYEGLEIYADGSFKFGGKCPSDLLYLQ